MLSLCARKFNKPRKKYQSYPKSTKINAFKQKICNVTTLLILNEFERLIGFIKPEDVRIVAQILMKPNQFLYN